MRYKYKKSNNIRKILSGKSNIVNWRIKYLKVLNYCKMQGIDIIYINETWENNSLCFGKC